MTRSPLFINSLILCLLAMLSPYVQSQEASPSAVRVTVTMNADGSRTVFQVDNEHHTGTATTTDPDGSPRGQVRYELDEAGRYKTGVVLGPGDKFRFKALYKYDSAGRLEQETHLGKDDAVINRIIYKYDPSGKPTGYVVVDANGKVISGVGTPTPAPTPKKRSALGR